MPLPHPDWNFSNVDIKSYDPLRDTALAAHLGNSVVRSALISHGLIASDGKILDRGASARVQIVEQEIDYAEKAQKQRLERIEFHKRRMGRRALEMQHKFLRHAHTQKVRERELSAIAKRKQEREELFRMRGFDATARGPPPMNLRPESASRAPLWALRPPMAHVRVVRQLREEGDPKGSRGATNNSNTVPHKSHEEPLTPQSPFRSEI